MTSPALFILSLALVCSICGIASEQEADHDTKTMRLSKFDVMDSHWTNQLSRKYINHIDNIEVTLKTKTKDELYKDNDIQVENFNMHKLNMRKFNGELRHYDKKYLGVKRRTKREFDDDRCETFKLESSEIMHPHNKNSLNKYYFNNTTCVTVINATQDNMVITLTFVDMFHIEYHPQCAYDYLEIRDGLHGYADLLAKVCGQAFPRQITTTGPNVWMKFRSDDTIEYEGFKINVEFKGAPSRKIPEACYMILEGRDFGVINMSSIDPACKEGSANQALDVLWTIKTSENTKIYLNFTEYVLEKPNECEENVIQVFGSVVELDSKLTQYCGSVANSVTTIDDASNIMHVRYFVSKTAKEKSRFRATYNAFRMLDTSKDGAECGPEEFDCEDNTCIDKELVCDRDAHCRLKADEDPVTCDKKTEGIFDQLHILVILIIFSLILSGMSFVFIFKCIRKLYQDHKIIKEHLRQSCEDRLDNIHGSRLTLDPKKLQMDSEPRASLERENQTNEMFKEQRNFSKHKQSSIDSDYIQETHLDLDEEPWRREVDNIPVEAEDIRIERNGRTRRSDLSRKEESMRSRTKETERDEVREKKEIRDVSVGAPDTKESGCQTRESLFQTDPPPSSDDIYSMAPGFQPAQVRPTPMRLNSSKEPLFSLISFSGSGTNSRGFSTFGYSGATIARPSPPATTNTSEITIELLKQVPSQASKSQKKLDRRPISTETTRSAPDVIIVSKPIR